MTTEFNGLNIVLLSIIIGINSLTFVLYYSDKQRAIKRKYRISEKTLLLFSFALGGVGAWLGMKTFRHKTQHALFKYSLPVAAILTISVVYYLLSQMISFN